MSAIRPHTGSTERSGVRDVIAGCSGWLLIENRECMCT